MDNLPHYNMRVGPDSTLEDILAELGRLQAWQRGAVAIIQELYDGADEVWMESDEAQAIMDRMRAIIAQADDNPPRRREGR